MALPEVMVSMAELASIYVQSPVLMAPAVVAILADSSVCSMLCISGFMVGTRGRIRLWAKNGACPFELSVHVTVCL